VQAVKVEPRIEIEAPQAVQLVTEFVDAVYWKPTIADEDLDGLLVDYE
jgi:hypothetical protein